MISELKPYSEYVDSDVKWLGKTPKHWRVLPNRALFDEVKDRNLPNEEMLSVTIKQGVIRQKVLLDGSSKKDSSNLDRSKYKLVRPGQIAYNKMRAWQGAIGVSDYKGIVSPAYVVVRSRDQSNLPRFFHHLYRTPQFAKEAERWSYGITSDMWSLRPEHFRLIFSPQPPPAEQAAIVKFLDWANTRIDRAIRAKRKVIALLSEQKQAIIHRIVTEGLKPDGKVKSTGIDWLSKVPEHWDVTALRNRYSQCLGKMLDSKRITGRHSVTYLRNTDVQWDKINTIDLPTMDILVGEYARYTVKLGDLLVCEGGEVGRCAIWDGKLEICGFQKALHRLRPRDPNRDLPKYFLFVLWAAAKYGVFNDGRVSTIAHLTGDKLRGYRFPFPPFIEQKRIVEEVENEARFIDEAVKRELSFISLLSELRNKVVSDIVTGKLDVTTAAASIPEEIDTFLPESDVTDVTDSDEDAELTEERI